MTPAELTPVLRMLDYSGPIKSVLDSLPAEAFRVFDQEINDGTGDNVLYFGLCRAAWERGTPNQIEVDDRLGVEIMTTSRNLLTMARMEREGTIIVEWPHSPFAHPEQSLKISKTALGEKRHQELRSRL